MSKARLWAVGVTAAIGLAATLFSQTVGLVLLVVLPTLAWVATMSTENDTPLQRYLNRRRWRERVRLGTTRFLPYTDASWEALTDEWANAPTRAERKEALRTLHAMRATPDGVEGMTWLQDGFGVPGVQWHREQHQEEYLAVVVSTTGQVEGIETDEVFDQASAGYGGILGAMGSRLSLEKRVQSITRALPADPALHEKWILENGDLSVPAVVHLSYKEVIDKVMAGQLIQRPMYVFSFPASETFKARAERRGEGLAGWRSLMNDEIAALERSMRAAGFRDVHTLSARATSAVIRHMQHPGYALDRVADMTPTTAWLPSEDQWSYTRYAGAPAGSDVTQSLARTARISAANMAVVKRNSLWMSPLLGGMERQVVRTLSFHQEVIPQDLARFQHEKDIVSDTADKNKKSRAGVLEDAVLTVEAEAAIQRYGDLLPGTGAHGCNWVGYITVSAADERDLMDACDHIAEAAADAGISALEWLDVRQSAAHAFTWPVGRGIRPSKASVSERVQQFAAGKEPEEAL
ncbi:SCO6880 family protein [Agreia sp. COWG]|uniref:SCO6880 family protein n=1 Tax=Agreia sp. COWG TaxID=2773266 RepID=UPI00192656D4|nr:SCO6880 family protein [Agreia sp. COWG]